MPNERAFYEAARREIEAELAARPQFDRAMLLRRKLVGIERILEAIDLEAIDHGR